MVSHTNPHRCHVVLGPPSCRDREFKGFGCTWMKVWRVWRETHLEVSFFIGTWTRWRKETAEGKTREVLLPTNFFFAPKGGNGNPCDPWIIRKPSHLCLVWEFQKKTSSNFSAEHHLQPHKKKGSLIRRKGPPKTKTGRVVRKSHL